MVAATGGVVTSVEPYADEAGAQMLRKGGNAADAAIAAAFAQGVVDPIYCGIGGGFHGLFRDGRTGEVAVVNAGGRAPAAARPEMWNVTVAGVRSGRWRGPATGSATRPR